MRQIDYLVLHCTATNIDATVEGILKYWKEHNGWRSPGYHYLIDYDGKIHELLPIEKQSNGVKGYNHNSIHISYIGGIRDGENWDTRSVKQIHSQIDILKDLSAKFPNAKIRGHYEFPDVKKTCPNFNVQEFLKLLNNN